MYHVSTALYRISLTHTERRDETMKSLAILGVATLFLVLIFQCCPSATSELPSDQVPTEQAVTAPSQPSAEETAAPTAAEESTPTSQPPSPTPAPEPVSFEFSGRGNEVTKLYPLDVGLIRCDYTYAGEHNFIVEVLDSQGDYAALIANEIGSCEGSSADSIRGAGDYLLNITADGDWTIRCQANAAGTQPSSRQPVAVFEAAGQGNEATDFIHLESGLLRGDYTYTGQHNFIVEVLDSQGDYAALIANEIGSCEGSSAASIGSAGEFLLNITADGDWTITLSQ
jgi:hypothetical protein